MTAPAPTLYEAARAERAAWNGAAPVAGRPATVGRPPAPTAIGPWAAFQAAFDDLLDAGRRQDAAATIAAREDLADLRARLALGGVAMPAVTRRVRAEPAVDARRLPDAHAR